MPTTWTIQVNATISWPPIIDGHPFPLLTEDGEFQLLTEDDRVLLARDDGGIWSVSATATPNWTTV